MANRLDKEIRFVMGEKIDVSKDDTNYYNTLEYYQKLNKSLGYGDDSFDWDKKMYKYKKNWLRYKSIRWCGFDFHGKSNAGFTKFAVILRY